MSKSRKGGRAKQAGAREPNGRLQRNVADDGTPELRLRKIVATGDERLPLTPLGILYGRRLITVEQYEAAARFRALHLAVFVDAPKAPLPLMAKLPSNPGPWDADDAAERQARGAETWESKRDRYNEIRDRLSAEQLATVQVLVIHEETGTDTGLFCELVLRNITMAAMLDPKGVRAPGAMRRRVDEIRGAVDRLGGERKAAWSEMSESQQMATMNYT